MKGGTGFAVGFLSGVAFTVLFIRLRQVVAENEGVDSLTDRIADHLEELERRAAAAGQVVAEA